MAVVSDSSKSSDHAHAPSGSAPVIVDLGKKPRKQIKQLREGRGKLLDEVIGVLAEMKTDGSISALAQPVVVVVRQKPRKGRSLLWPLA
jgi:hypothetical protein